MSMNPPAPLPTKMQQAVRTTQRVAANYSLVVLALLSLILGFILGRV